LTQEALAEWFGTHQERFPRWMAYLRAGDWRRLMSRRHGPLLSLKEQQSIVGVWARHLWWTAEEVHAWVTSLGLEVTVAQVKEAETLSGLKVLRRALHERFHLGPDSLRPKDRWLVQQLLVLVEALLSQVEAGRGLTPEELIEVAGLQALAAKARVNAPPTLKPLPWLLRVERVVFGHWVEVSDGPVRCIYCGSAHVVRKSRKPRLKKYYDPEGELQTVEVYRYYCRNPACDKGSFTHLPPGLVPYSRYRTEVHLLGVQMYAWGYSTYRRTGQALGVAGMTAYRWVSAWGYELLPVAALFGVVKSSGVVGIDEKYVLVPKNDKAEGKMRRWMYVYLAVDVYTYDLLHIALYPYNDRDSAHAFLLALRAKGYHPRVIVTDLRQEYGPLIAQVFPKAQHHECIFHALQNVQDHVKEVYGAGYAQTHPEAEVLKQAIYHIFEARTKRTAQKRYEKVMTWREPYVTQSPGAATIFDFLERHWPTLVNAIESNVIPITNTAGSGTPQHRRTDHTPLRSALPELLWLRLHRKRPALPGCL
jgi:transposase-like protein